LFLEKTDEDEINFWKLDRERKSYASLN